MMIFLPALINGAEKNADKPIKFNASNESVIMQRFNLILTLNYGIVEWEYLRYLVGCEDAYFTLKDKITKVMRWDKFKNAVIIFFAILAGIFLVSTIGVTIPVVVWINLKQTE